MLTRLETDTRILQPQVLATLPLSTRPAHIEAGPHKRDGVMYDVCDIGQPPTTFGESLTREEIVDRFQIPRDQKRAMLLGYSLEDARRVNVTLPENGLGDKVMSMRVALAIAATMPNTAFNINGGRDFIESGIFDVPPNAVLSAQGSKSDVTIFLDRFKHTSYKKYDDQDGLSPAGYHLGLYDGDFHMIHEEVRLLSGNTNNIDFHRYLALRAFGAPLQLPDIFRPMVTLDREQVLRPPKRDMLIVPEAREMPTGDRSRKSISAEQWAKIFKEVSRRGLREKVGIVAGHTFPEYVGSVFEAAAWAGLDVEMVNTPTLSDFVDQVVASDMVVGGDTGPMHIAAEAMKAALKMGRVIGLRHLFTTLVYSPEEYGISVPGSPNARALHYRGLLDPKLSFTANGTDISNLPAQVVADFITC